MTKRVDIESMTEKALRKGLSDPNATASERLDAVRLGLVWMKIKVAKDRKYGDFFEDDDDDSRPSDDEIRD